MSSENGVIYCLLVGGPLDGMTTSEWRGCKTITMNDDLQASSETRMGGWHIYKRCDPDVISRDGLTEFHFFTTGENANE